MKRFLTLFCFASFAFMGCPEPNSADKSAPKTETHSHEDGSNHGDHSHGDHTHGDGHSHDHGDDAHQQEEFTVGEEDAAHGHGDDQEGHSHDGLDHDDH